MPLLAEDAGIRTELDAILRPYRWRLWLIIGSPLGLLVTLKPLWTFLGLPAADGAFLFGLWILASIGSGSAWWRWGERRPPEAFLERFPIADEQRALALDMLQQPNAGPDEARLLAALGSGLSLPADAALQATAQPHAIATQFSTIPLAIQYDTDHFGAQTSMVLSGKGAPPRDRGHPETQKPHEPIPIKPRTPAGTATPSFRPIPLQPEPPLPSHSTGPRTPSSREGAGP